MVQTEDDASFYRGQMLRRLEHILRLTAGHSVKITTKRHKANTPLGIRTFCTGDASATNANHCTSADSGSGTLSNETGSKAFAHVATSCGVRQCEREATGHGEGDAEDDEH